MNKQQIKEKVGNDLSQTEAVKQHLNAYKKISWLDAFDEYGIKRLAARIHEIRNQGYDIETDSKELSNGKEVAVYRLNE